MPIFNVTCLLYYVTDAVTVIRSVFTYSKDEERTLLTLRRIRDVKQNAHDSGADFLDIRGLNGNKTVRENKVKAVERV